MLSARSVRVRGVVQGVGFRPFVYRLAQENTLTGWVLNAADGVEIRVEGTHEGVQSFLRDLTAHAPPAANIVGIDVEPAAPSGLDDFTIRDSTSSAVPTVRISPDLATCDRCLQDMADPADPRFAYPYINCTDCGPRYSIITGLPYDRRQTTMDAWPMDALCANEYHDPLSRRFHAQPVACPVCGPHLSLRATGKRADGDAAVIAVAAQLLREGRVVALKGVGGYHLACDARNEAAVQALRDRKFRKEKPFALLVPDLAAAEQLVELTPELREILRAPARPIVLAPASVQLPGIAPDTHELGVMLAHTPLHHLLFAAGAPPVLVMTSANRSSEPIAYRDDQAVARLEGIADAFVIGERPIARRVEDSVVRATPWGPSVLRRGRGYAPGAVATIPGARPILALGADLKNAVTLVVDGQAFVSQHIGDLEHFESLRAFGETVDDLLAMYQLKRDQVLLAHDLHPEYRSTRFAREFDAMAHHPVQHHRAHVASVLAERGEWRARVLGVALDGTGYGDDGTIWGGEFFVGSVEDGFERVAHLRRASLPGGDAASRLPVQAAAGFLAGIAELPPLEAAPFDFPARYAEAVRLVKSGTRTFATTSAGRLFDCAAALLGFTRAVTFEGQAAIWLEHLAGGATVQGTYSFPFDGRTLDYRPLLSAVARDRAAGRDVAEIARTFQRSVAVGIHDAVLALGVRHDVEAVVLSGGVFQNAMLLADLAELLRIAGTPVWINHAVPPNDGGVSLGQAALAAFAHR
ncbi:MAG: carbamoyltransferase HypF [Gemmatimonadaceae bacterium]